MHMYVYLCLGRRVVAYSYYCPHPQGEVANLQSQMRISKLSSDDLQRKLTEAYGEREDLAQRLKATEDRLRDKVCTCVCVHVCMRVCVRVHASAVCVCDYVFV